MRNRYYDPATGKFTQEDPIGLAGGLNLYGFAGGDPINFADPFGLCEDPDDPDCKVSLSQQAKAALREGVAKLAAAAASVAGAAADALSPIGDLIRATSGRDPLSGEGLSAGQRVAAGGLVIVGLVPGAEVADVAANLRRTVKAAQGADVTVDAIGGFTRARWSVPGGSGGAARTNWTKIINAEGRTVRMFHDSFDSFNVFQHRKFKVP
jgi:uncharacterized protein RhaS with RHS repeats